jgi:PAP2 superfamily
MPAPRPAAGDSGRPWLTAVPGGCRKASSAASVRPRPGREIVLVAVLFLGYKLGRAAAAGRVGLADANADRVWAVERWIGLPSEHAVQHLLLRSDIAVRAVNAFYAWVHFPAAALFLVWLYLRRPEDYLLGRRMLAAVTAVALVVHVTFPLAPPRLAGLGFVDTAATLGPAVYGSPAADKISNLYAAMPSLHVGWALVVAVVLMRGTASRWRLVWLAYPTTTTLVVVATANHYWLDALAAAVLGCVAALGGAAALARAAAPGGAAALAGTAASVGGAGPAGDAASRVTTSCVR